MYTFNLPIINAILIASTCYTTVIQATQTPKTTLNNISMQNQIHVQQKISDVESNQKEIENLLVTNEDLMEELATIKISKELAKKDAQSARCELEQMKSAMVENQSNMDAILNDIQSTKKKLADIMIDNEILRSTLAENNKSNRVSIREGDLVILTPDITPARPMNLNRVFIKNRHSCGVVVVNVLINENGEVLDAKLLQGLSGHGALIDKANEVCLEQAKRIIFDPARTADGKTRVRVWQGVGILIG